jgi:hypothetical protein
MGDTAIREAACACGGLKLRLKGDPEYVSSCACQACQRRTGAPFGVTAIFLEEQVTEQTGEVKVWRRVAESGNWIDYSFCPGCGTTVSWLAEGRPGKVMVAGGCFADKDFPPPQRMIWIEHRAPWVRPPEGAPEITGAP